MFMELIDKGYKRTVNTEHITMIFPSDDRTGIKLIDYSNIVYIDMNYKEFMEKFREIHMLNALLKG